MEFKGEEFIRNLEIEKEKAQLQEQFDALEAEKAETIIQNTSKYYDDEPVIVDIHKDNSHQQLDDILWTDSNNESKKKYIILAIALSILFILTIVIIRLISADSDKNKAFSEPQVETIAQDKILDAPNADEKYQAIIDKKLKKDLDIDKIAQQEIPVPKEVKKEKKAKPAETSDGDLFGMLEKEKKVEVKQPVKTQKVEPKETPKQQVAKEKTDVKPEPIKEKVVATSVTGSYVQVGAFTKTPNKALLTQIKKAGYNYIIHKMDVKGTTYNKVLIGPYENRKSVDAVIGKIKKDLNKPGAYVLKLK